jgi:hypothetical protein
MSWSVFADPQDGARDIEIVGVSNESASGPGWLDVENLQSNQTHAPGRRRRFYLAFPGRDPYGQRRRIPTLRYALRACDGVRGRSSQACLARQADEQAFRTRGERRKIDDAMDVRRTIRLRSDCKQSCTQKRISVRREQSRVQPGEEIERGAPLVFSLLRANHWRELRDVVLCLARQRPAFDEMFVVTRRTGIVGGEKSGCAIAIEHLVEIRRAGENVVARIAGIRA